MPTTMVSSIRAAALAILVCATMAAPVPSAIAQELAPEHLALARRYIDATDRGAIYEVTIVQTGVQTLQTLLPQNPDVAEEIADAIAVVITDYRDEKGTLLDQFARLYALQFTVEELQEIVDFYESPVGQKLAQTNVSINADVQRVMTVFTNNLRREFLARVRAELRSQDINL